MSKRKQLSRASPHSCCELLGHAEEKEGKEVDNELFFIIAPRFFMFILRSPLQINRPIIFSVNTLSLKNLSPTYFKPVYY